MRVLMSFTVQAPAPRQVIMGPAWGTEHVMEIFELMHFAVSTERGEMSLVQFAEGLARAKRLLGDEPAAKRQKVARTLESLATWATIAKLKGATHFRWHEDF